MTRQQAQLWTAANENGYETALFSENPSFSSAFGFGGCVDKAHEFIDRKLLPSEFAPVTAIDELSVSEAWSLSKELLFRPDRIRNLINTAYTTYRYLSDRESSYPHHGRKVVSHLNSYLSGKTDSTVTVTNLLDPHNPYYGAPPGQQLSRSAEEDQALRDRQGNVLYMFTDEPLPDKVRAVYGGWEALFEAEKAIYEEFSREADRLVKRWHNHQPSRFNNDLIVTLGDHGQLFGAEGIAGHGLSLHPRGIHVPLAISPPSKWECPERTVSDPVSIAGLGQALIDVVAGKITATDELVTAITEYSRGPTDAVIACIDGPTNLISRLYQTDRINDALVADHCVRKVACIYDNAVDIYRCHWDLDRINVMSYAYTEDGREPLPDRRAPPVPSAVKEWVSQAPKPYAELDESWRPDDEQSRMVRQRLEGLGYR